jgi:hypothetical protein
MAITIGHENYSCQVSIPKIFRGLAELFGELPGAGPGIAAWPIKHSRDEDVNRIEVLRKAMTLGFAESWPARIEDRNGKAPAYASGHDDLLAAPSAVDHPGCRGVSRVFRA